MAIDLFRVESFLYGWIDAEGMRENSRIEKRFELGNNHFVQVRINNFSKTPLNNKSIVKTKEFVFSLNFWKVGQEPWFRVDNESKDKTEPEKYLHFHKDDFSLHQKLEEKYTLSELISFTFDWIYEILKEKFPNEVIKDSSGFVGCA